MRVVKKVPLFFLVFPIFNMFLAGLVGLGFAVWSHASSFFTCWTDPHTQEALCRAVETTDSQLWALAGHLALVAAIATVAGWVSMPEKRTIIEAVPFGNALENRLNEWRQQTNQRDPIVAAHINELEGVLEQYKRSCSLQEPV